MQYLISWNLSCQSLQCPRPKRCILTCLWQRCLHSSAWRVAFLLLHRQPSAFPFHSLTVLIKGVWLSEPSATLLHFLLASYRSLTLVSFSSLSKMPPRISSANYSYNLHVAEVLGVEHILWFYFIFKVRLICKIKIASCVTQLLQRFEVWFVCNFPKAL